MTGHDGLEYPPWQRHLRLVAAAADQNRCAAARRLGHDRAGAKATLITSQQPIEHWHAWLGDATIADAILDRLMQHHHRSTLSGESHPPPTPSTRPATTPNTPPPTPPRVPKVLDAYNVLTRPARRAIMQSFAPDGVRYSFSAQPGGATCRDGPKTDRLRRGGTGMQVGTTQS